MPWRIDTPASPDWLDANRANWEERLAHHLASPMYDLAPLRAGRGLLHPIEETELGDVQELSILHLQCRFGYDTLSLAQRGARVTGIDFDRGAIAKATELAAELGLSGQARFVAADVLKADQALDAPAAFDRVFVTWGTICWLPDLRTWARIVAHFLKPGGWLYFADMHPAAATFDSETATGPDLPGWFWPYFTDTPLIEDQPSDYASGAILQSGNLHEWRHTISDLVTALLQAGLTLRMLHEHDALPWPAYENLVPGGDRMYRWPDKAWLPLALSLKAEKPG